MVNDPGERTSIAQGSYLNFVSRKFVNVSPSRKATYCQSCRYKVSRGEGSKLRFDDITSAKKWMFVGGPCNFDSDKTFVIFLHADCLSLA